MRLPPAETSLAYFYAEESDALIGTRRVFMGPFSAATVDGESVGLAADTTRGTAEEGKALVLDPITGWTNCANTPASLRQ